MTDNANTELENAQVDAQNNVIDNAVAQGGSYDVIKKRLTEQGKQLNGLTNSLNEARLEEFGNSQMQVVARTRVRTENNCVARDMVQVGEYLLFGYNVFIGLKQETKIEDVFSLFRLEQDADNPENVELVQADFAGTFLSQSGFVQDFEELYRYYKHTKLLQVVIKDSKLLACFQIGERIEDIRVFRWAVSADGSEVTYIDNRGERDIALPPAYDFEWIETTREDTVHGKYAHINVLDTVFVETIGGDLTIKIENNTEDGLGIYSEPVDDKTQSLDDASVHYAKVGTLILLKVLPYRENVWRYFIYNTLTEAVLRLDAIGQSCVQLPEDHGIVFPGGYYLQEGEYKFFDGVAGSAGADSGYDLKFKRRIKSPNGEDVLYLFYDVEQGITGLFAYNLIKKQLQNPIYCSGYALADSGQLVLFNAEEDPTRVHPMQVWQTPYESDEFASNAEPSNSFYGKIGNAELVRGISDIYSVGRLINNQAVSLKLYEELSYVAKKVFDDYYWLEDAELAEISGSLKEVISTSELVIDEFAKVQSIQKQTAKAIQQAQAEQIDLLRAVRTKTFETADDYVASLASLRQQKGHLVSLESLRYLDETKLNELKEEIDTLEGELSTQTVNFLVGDDALTPYEARLGQFKTDLDACETNAQLKPILENIENTASGLDMLTELLGTLDVSDATVRTQIIDDISAIYSRLNQTKAQAKQKAKTFGSAEAVAQFGAQFKLFSQSIANALSVANTPEKCDEQLARLLMQLEELESQFTSEEAGLGENFLTDIVEKREEIYETFESHKQQLLDERGRKAQTLSDAASRMLASIEKRAMASGTTGFKDQDALNTYFASDALVQKVRELAQQLRDYDYAVKADDIEARFKGIQDQAMRSLRDKTDIFEDGGKVIKLGKHKFSVNTQTLDLTILPRANEKTGDPELNIHLTGTDFYEPVSVTELNDMRAYWDMAIASETPQIYRGEYLAYSVLQSAEKNEDGLTLTKLYDALATNDDSHGLDKLVKDYTTPRYKLGFEKGVHDHDAVKILAQILPAKKQAGLLTFEPTARALAQVFWWQVGLGSLANTVTPLQTSPLQGGDFPPPSRRGLGGGSAPISNHHTWQDRAMSAVNMSQVFGSNKALDLLVGEVAQSLTDFVNAEFGDTQYTPAVINQASEYLVKHLGSANPSSITNELPAFTTSKYAGELLAQLKHSLNDANWQGLHTALAKLYDKPAQAWQLAESWLSAYVESVEDVQSDNADDGEEETVKAESAYTHFIPEAVGILLTQLSDNQKRVITDFVQANNPTDSDSVSGFGTNVGASVGNSLANAGNATENRINHIKQLKNLPRQISEIDLQLNITDLLGDHSIIQTVDGKQVLNYALDAFLARLNHHEKSVIPAYEHYLQLRQQVISDQRASLRLDEFKPRPLSSFVRNRLINESYLPLIGDNLAKQMGTVGDTKRTDLMGLLMMISPPGYGKTTLMEYVANRLGLIFMKINCPSLGHDVHSLDPAQAPNATARQELYKLNLALEMGNNVMLYLDDIQHTHPEFLQKFISLCDGTRRIEGVWQDSTKTYDMRGKKFCVVMAGNPYTESGEAFKVPDMLANRADIYNLGDILGGMEEQFALSYVENAMTSNPVLAPLATREMQDIYNLIGIAKGENINATELKHPYSGSEINEITGVLQKMFVVQDVLLKINQQYIQSAAQDDKYRTEPAFKLQGSYRNMNKLTEKISSVMNDAELNQLIDDHYLGESQLLTTGAEANLLKLAELREVMTDTEQTRWNDIKQDFMRNKAMGGDDTDTGNKVVAQLIDVAMGFKDVNKTIGAFTEQYTQQYAEQYAEQQAANAEVVEDTEASRTTSASESLAALMPSLIEQQGKNAAKVSKSINKGFADTLEKLVKIYSHNHDAEEARRLSTIKETQDMMKVALANIVKAIQGMPAAKTVSETKAADEPAKVTKGKASKPAEQGSTANELATALQPLLLRLDEQLKVAASKDQTGKQIVSNLERLNQIIDEME